MESKAIEKGILVVYVDPKYPNQICPKCGHKDINSRN
ncbi:MAG: zinc ribbon domain-containing protein [Promethearchaeia archaeon]